MTKAAPRLDLRLRLITLLSALTLLLGLLLAPMPILAGPSTLQETFTGATMPVDWVLGGEAYLTGDDIVDPQGDGWLRLTEDHGNRSGFAYYDVAFSSAGGLVITFDYATWGGSGGDGLTFFLFDGATPTFAPGGFGGSLGYAQRSGVLGLTRGYLGVGIDEYGDFSSPSEGRNGGPGFRSNAIAVRGPGDGMSGYAYIAGTDSFRESLDRPRVPFRPVQISEHYRRVEVRLEQGSGGYTVAVLLQQGQNDPLTEVIPPTLIGQDPPATLKLGFVASTSGATNHHEIRNLSVAPALTPTVVRGTVTESVGGQPLANATVQVVDGAGHVLLTTTDALGQWSISSADTALVAGTATVSASYGGYCAVTKPANLASGVATQVDSSLSPAVVTGVVRDAATDVPLVGATVVMTDAVGVPFTTTTALGGIYRFENSLGAPMSTGAVGVTASKTRYLTETVVSAITDCGPNVIDVALDTTDIWFYKDDGRATASPGELLTYTLRVENRGSMAAAGVVVVDDLRCHEYVSVVGMTPGAAEFIDTYTWILADALPAGASKTLTMTVRVHDWLPDGVTVMENYGRVSVLGSPEADLTNNEQSDLTSVTAHPNLTLIKTGDTAPLPVQVNQVITYTLTGDNRGNALATGVVITDQLDGLVTYVPNSAELIIQGSSYSVTVVTQTLSDLVFELPDIPPGMGGSLTYAVETGSSFPTGTQYISNTAIVTLDQQDGDASNNHDHYQMPAQAFMDLHVHKLALPEPFPARPGGLIRYILRYGNRGNTAGSNVSLIDALPSLSGYVAGSLYVNGLPVSDPPLSDGVLDLSLVDGQLGSARYEGVLSYTVRISDVLPMGVEQISNAVSMTDAVLLDGNPANNQDTAITPVLAAPDLKITIDDGQTLVEAGNTVTLTITFRNGGDQDAANVVVSSTLGAGLDYVSGSASDAGAYDGATRSVRWDVPSLPVGGAMSYTLRAQVAPTDLAGAVAAAEATIADDGANGPEPTPGDNYAVDVDRVVRPYVVVNKAVTDPLLIGQPVTFTIDYRNLSKAPGRNVSMTDTLPAYLDFLDATGSWSRQGDDILWDLGQLAPGSQGSVQFSATLNGFPDTLQYVQPTFAREMVQDQVVVTSTLSDIPSPWYAGSALPPNLRVLFSADQEVGPVGWNENPRLPGARTFEAWPAPVAAGVEGFYWYDETDLAARWVAHDPAGQVDPSYSLFRHVFYLPLNVCQPRVTLQMAADDLAEAYVNGVYVGQDYGAGSATALTDVAGVQPGANLLGVHLLNNDHGGHVGYPDGSGAPTCHPGLLYNLQVSYLLRPFVLAPPVVRAGETYSLTIDTDALAGVAPYVYSIDYGEGLSGTNATSHVYTVPGTYTVTIKATDAVGQIGLDTLVVEVMPAYSQLVVNNVALRAESTASAYLSQGGTANTAFLGLLPILDVSKTMVDEQLQADGSRLLTYQIVISTSGVVLDAVPLYDGYDPELLTFVGADPAPSSVPYPGLLVWDDLTGSPPNGLDRPLTAGAPLTVSATFRVDAHVSGTITNTAWVDDAADQAGYTVNSAKAEVGHDLPRISVALSPPSAWGGSDLVCAGWRQRWTLSATNDGEAALSHVNLMAMISDTLPMGYYDVVLAESSPEAIVGQDGVVRWEIGALAPGETVSRDLVLRTLSSVAPGTVVEVCSVLLSDQVDSEPACYQGQVVVCDAPTPQPSPTPAQGRPLYLPLVFK